MQSQPMQSQPTGTRMLEAGSHTSTQPMYYPESDGEPMGETDFHIAAILYLRQALRFFFRQVENVYVAANMLLYYEEGNPSACKAPDVFVVKGVEKHDRRIYKLWEEAAAPCVVFEITSRGTRLDDLGTKRALYEILGIQEYFLFDPLGEYLQPRLQGFRLASNQGQAYYHPLPLTEDGTLYSQELELILQPENALLRLVEPTTTQMLPTLDEAVDQMSDAIQRADAESQRADAESQRAERLAAKLRELGLDPDTL